MGLFTGKRYSIFSSNCQLWKCILHFYYYFYQIQRASIQGYQIGKKILFWSDYLHILVACILVGASWWSCCTSHITVSPPTVCRVTASWLPVHWLSGYIMITFLLTSLIHESSHYKCINLITMQSPSFGSHCFLDLEVWLLLMWVQVE